MKDPRVALVTITGVKVTKDLSFSDVYFTAMVLDTDDEQEAAKIAEDTLNKAQPYLRTLLAKAVQLRVMPHLRFHYDFTLSTGLKMDGLIKAARGSDKNLPED